MAQFGQEFQVLVRYNMPESLSVLSNQIVACINRGNYHNAMALCQNGSADLKQSLGDDYDKYVEPILRTMYAKILSALGHYEMAVEVLNEVLLSQKKKLGKKHQLLGATLNNLAVVRFKQGKYKEVEKLAKKALEVYDQIIDRDRVNIIMKLNELALYFNKQGKWKEVERCDNRVLETCEAMLNSYDPEIAASLNELAMSYLQRGKEKDAEVVFKKILNSAYVEEHNTPEEKSTSLVTKEEEKNGEKVCKELSFLPANELANIHSPLSIALDGLTALYEKQGNYIGAKALKDFADQQRINPPPLPAKRRRAQPSSPPELPPKKITPFPWNISQTRVMMTPSAPPLSTSYEEMVSLEKAAPEQIQMVAEVQLKNFLQEPEIKSGSQSIVMIRTEQN